MRLKFLEKSPRYILGISLFFCLLLSLPVYGFAAMTWVPVSTAGMGDPIDNTWLAVTWSPQLQMFAAVGSGSNSGTRVMTSTDGVNWTVRGSAADMGWDSIAWSPTANGTGLFVAVANTGTGNRVMTSPDGITWTSRASAADTNNWRGVTWSPTAIDPLTGLVGVFVAVSATGTNHVMTSHDGITWTLRASANDANSWTSVVWSPENNIFVAVGNTGTNRVMTWAGGAASWTSVKAANTAGTELNNGWTSVAWSATAIDPTTTLAGVFVAVASNGTSNRVMTSHDGTSWVGMASATETNGWSGVTVNSSGVFVATSAGGTNRVMTWTGGSASWTAVASAVETNGWNGITWSPTLNLFVAVGNTGTNNRAMYSSTGSSWTAASTSFISDNTWYSIAWSPSLNLFVAVATSSCTSAGRCIMTSPDGVNWTYRTVPGNNYYWTSVVWSPSLGLFVAVAQASTGFSQFNRVITSPDGINWTTRTTSDENQWLSVTWSPDLSLFVAVANGATGTGERVMTSPNGITWTPRTAAAANAWVSVTWSPALGIFAAVATSGTGNRVMTSPDGITWTSQVSAADNNWESITWSPALNLFVAVSDTGTGNRVMTSPDGITWTSRASAADMSWESVTWSPDVALFVAVGAGSINNVMASPDGINWTLGTGAANNAWSSVVWSPALGIFAAVGQSGFRNRAMISGPVLPTSVSVTPSATSATVTWNTDNSGTSQVFYGLTSGYGSSTTLDSSTVTSHSVLVSGLSCSTTYHFKATSTGGGLTSNSNDATFTTSGCEPVVTTGAASSIGETSATLSGTITSIGGSSVTSRGFNWGPTASYGTVTTETGSFGAEVYTTALTGLTCNTTYHYQAYAINVAGTATGSDATFTTAACPVATVVTIPFRGGGHAILPSESTKTNPDSSLGSSGTGGAVLPFTFTKNLQIGSRNNEVFELQKYLNKHGFLIAKTGVGSPGNETNYFGVATRTALGNFQLAVKILTSKKSPSLGIFGSNTRKYIHTHP